MTLQELFDLILVRSGEFIIGADNIELDIDKFTALVNYALSVYSKYKPQRRRLQITISNYKYTFNDPPSSVVDVTPTYSTILNPLLSQFSFSGQIPIVEWEYRSPTLYTNFNGNAEVEALYPYKVIDGVVPDIHDELFYDLVTGYFLEALARSRRAFTLQELPITTDAEVLASEARDLIKDTIEALQASSILL